MRATIDKAGRLVIPKEMRDRLGFQPGPVEVMADGAALRVEQEGNDELAERDGVLLVPAKGPPVTDEMVRELRDLDRR